MKTIGLFVLAIITLTIAQPGVGVVNPQVARQLIAQTRGQQATPQATQQFAAPGQFTTIPIAGQLGRTPLHAGQFGISPFLASPLQQGLFGLSGTPFLRQPLGSFGASPLMFGGISPFGGLFF